MVKRYELGEQVKLVSTGPSYSSPTSEFVWKYVVRYKPINVSVLYPNTSYKSLEIVSSYRTKSDLALKKNLKWKVRFVHQGIYLNEQKTLYIISSNKNHMLVVNGDAIDKLET